MIKRLILFLVRRRLGLKKYEKFQFTNQKSSTNYYYFTSYAVMKRFGWYCEVECESSVSLNWLLDDNCEIRKVDW